MIEHYFNCPYCWQNISMLIDTSINKQDYIEDCEVCCNPIKIEVAITDNELVKFNAISIDQ